MSTKRILTVWGVVFIVVMVCLMVFGQTAMKISQYPNTNNLGPNQLFLVTAGATNMNVKASDMPAALSVATLAQMYGVGANLTGLVYSVVSNTTNFAKSITNGDLYISGHLTVQSNLSVGGTNSTVEFEAGTVTVSNDITVNGGASFGAAVTSSANSASNGPAANEFPNASWVRGLFNNGQLLYAGPGQRTDATNVSSGQIMYLFTNNIPPTSSRKYATVNAGDYIGSVMTSNSLTFLQGPIYVHAYLQSSNGNGGQSVSVHPEIYYSYDRTNWQGDFSANDQVLAQSTNLYEWVVSFPAVTSTNATGFWVERRFKVGAASGATHPDVYFHLGTNYLTSSNDASHIAFSGPSSQMGVVGSNGTLYAAGTINFVGNTKMTNVNGTMSVDVTPGGSATYDGVAGVLRKNPINGVIAWHDDEEYFYFNDNFKGNAVDKNTTSSSGNGGAASMSTTLIAASRGMMNGFFRLSHTNAYAGVGSESKGYTYATQSGPQTNAVTPTTNTWFDTRFIMECGIGTEGSPSNSAAMFGLVNAPSTRPAAQSRGVFWYFDGALDQTPYWICCVATASTLYTNISAFPVTFNTVSNRLGILINTNAGTCTFYTNGVACYTDNTHSVAGISLIPTLYWQSTVSTNVTTWFTNFCSVDFWQVSE